VALTPQELAYLEALYSGEAVPMATARTAVATPSAPVPTWWGIVAVVLFAALLLFWGTVEEVVEDVTDAVEAGVRAAARAVEGVARAPEVAVREVGEAVRSA
jgi:hypothetical protein